MVMDMSQPMIKVSAATKHYKGKAAVDNISFDVAAGRVTGFVGPNGAGKSTTMRMMVGLSRPDSGEVRYAGTRYTDLVNPARVVGSVLDARCMHPGRTARNHLRSFAALSGVSNKRVDEVLEAVGLETAANQKAGGFSLGMRQRLALAGALLGNPEVLLLDEPANGLDPDGIRWLRTYLGGFAADGGTVFVSSHLISELSQFADDLVVIGAGKLLANDSVANIMSNNESSIIVGSPDPGLLGDLLVARGGSVTLVDQHLVVTGLSRQQVSHLAFDNRIRVDQLSESTTSLEDTLLEMTSASAEFASV
ncbi:MAG: ABC-2 type transport system ATP-binding protein [Acidimicrobiales bacterium]|jgi:ABC-2 type transport system ATP-binding protein